ncbi:unnamed protein product [Microthlaspi erraticum]|uniref:Uncharacterized protein n=1 Tax=Microthlaspi erraticum TaxID=1685480 RepID=A0A6D2KW00_9BRAS|nr:unnamed protein product [Microthlaspi erraticum]
MNSISRARVIGALSGPFPSDFHHFHVENRLWTYKPGLDRVEAWPVELRNSTGRAGLQDGFLLLPLRPVELRPCTKSFHAPHVPYAPNAPKDLFQRTKHAYCPQRTGRQGRGLERADGHQEHSIDHFVLSSIELAAPLLLPRSVWLLGLGGAWLARTVRMGSIGSGDSPGKVLDRTRIQGSRMAPPGQLDHQLDRVEFPLFGLDRVLVELERRPWNSSSFSACCLLLPLVQMRGSVRLLGREPPWSGEE